MDFTGKTVDFGSLNIQKVDGRWHLPVGHVVKVGASDKLECPIGMWTDGASIPRFFWRLIGHPMSPEYVDAAVIHDAGYLGVLTWWRLNGELWLEENYTREEVDTLFLELLKCLGVSWWRRRAMYLAVRTFGGSGWTEK